MLIVAVGGVGGVEESVFFKDTDPVWLCHAPENISALIVGTDIATQCVCKIAYEVGKSGGGI